MLKDRLNDLDIAKGMAIFLVVVGHVVARQRPLGNQWYTILRFLIYKFHMPFFMFLSGAIFYYTFKPFKSFNKEYREYILIKSKRLMPGFIIFGLLIIVGKVVASKVIFVDNIQTNFLQSMTYLFVLPLRSASSSLWYIYVLLEFYLAFPVILAIFRRNLPAIVVASFVIHFIPFFFKITDFLLLNRLLEYGLYFSLGFVFINYYESCVSFIQKYSIAFYIIFIVSFLSIPFFDRYISQTIIGLLSIPALYAVAFLITKFAYKKYLLVLSEYTFSVYLMHTIFIGLTKGVLMRVISWNYSNFLFYFPILILVGIFFPITLQKYVFTRNSFLNSITK